MASPQCGRTCDRTFKNHFISGLCSVDKNFPLHLWDKLLPQAELTLNLLRGSRINPSLSAHAQLHGAVDFNRTPIAPPGIRVLVHVKPAERTTWSPHGADGWYTGPAQSRTGVTPCGFGIPAPPVCDTLSWFPTKVTMPLASSNDLILAGIHDILHALHHPSPASPLAPLTDSHHRALIELTSILTSLASPQTNPIGHATVAPLRVASRQPLLFSRRHRQVDPPLRVGAPSSTTSPFGTFFLVAPRRVQFAPLPSDTIVDTFRTSTGFVGKRRRRSLRYNPRTPPGPTSKTIHPLKLTKKKLTTPPTATPARRPVVPVHHQHGTRANKQRPLHHIAAAARALLLHHKVGFCELIYM
ncbi:hypothetical protein MHU86_16893 [Fragilaria crotonensis]|nr:hypothetical protein MHU86_16893 [Fragilaria crotonensis]